MSILNLPLEYLTLVRKGWAMTAQGRGSSDFYIFNQSFRSKQGSRGLDPPMLYSFSDFPFSYVVSKCMSEVC